MVGKNPRVLNAGNTPRATYEELWATLTQGEVWRGEFHNTRKDGSTYIELATIAPLKQADGQVTHYVAVKEDVTERRAAETRIQHIAWHDALTGLPNRTLLADRLSQDMRRVRRSGAFLALAYIDLDGFKAVNDTHGHEVGDRLLVEIARRMRGVLRDVDTVARLGGDEFAAIFADLADAAASQPMIERLLATIAEPVPVDGLRLEVSASIGVSDLPAGRRGRRRPAAAPGRSRHVPGQARRQEPLPRLRYRT